MTASQVNPSALPPLPDARPAPGWAPPAVAESQRRPHFSAANGLATAMVLSLSAGYLDGFTFTAHGHAFASAMTGNLVLLGINLATLNPRGLANLYPLLAFVFGAMVATLLARKAVARRLPFSPHFMTLLIEIAVLTGVAFLPIGLPDTILVALVTLSNAMQNTSFRNIGTETYNSIIMTGNLQNMSRALAVGTLGYRAAWSKVRDLGAVLTSFLAGAALGALLTPRFGNHVTLAPAVLLAVVAIALVFSSDDESVFQPAERV